MFRGQRSMLLLSKYQGETNDFEQMDNVLLNHTCTFSNFGKFSSAFTWKLPKIKKNTLLSVTNTICVSSHSLWLIHTATKKLRQGKWEFVKKAWGNNAAVADDQAENVGQENAGPYCGDAVQVLQSGQVSKCPSTHFHPCTVSKEHRLVEEKLNRSQYWTKYDEESELGLANVRKQHCQASIPVDVTWPQRKRMAKELHLEKRSVDKYVENRIQVQLEEDGGGSTEQFCWSRRLGTIKLSHSV